jgi:hypothetical protein
VTVSDTGTAESAMRNEFDFALGLILESLNRARTSS